jgi:hypothetical protein
MADISMWNVIINTLAVGSAWIVGEGGRIAIAGGAGGFARWLNTEHRHIRDGMVAVVGGMFTATYLWPFILWVFGLFPGSTITETPNNIAMAAFVAGALGMSFVKITTAMIEAKLDRATKGNDDV